MISLWGIASKHWRSVSREGVDDMSHDICMCCDSACDIQMDMGDKCGDGVLPAIG